MGVHNEHGYTDPACERVALGTGLLTEIVAGGWCFDCNPLMPLWAMRASDYTYKGGLEGGPPAPPFVVSG
jgi:hypothetical protein